MAKKGKVKKTLVDQILDKAKIDHDSLSFNGLEGELPEDVARESIYKTLALKGDKTRACHRHCPYHRTPV